MPYKDPEVAKAKKKEYQVRHRDRLRAYLRDYYRKTLAAMTDEQRTALRNISAARQRARPRDEKNAAQRKWWRANAERMAKKAKEARQRFRANHPTRYAEYTAKRRPQANVRRKERYAADVAYRLATKLRNRVHDIFRRRNCLSHKPDASLALLGCSMKELISHIEKQFLPGMTWDNYNYKGWHVDHRIPLASVDLTDENQREIVLSFRNLQPLWAIDNLRKNARLDWKPPTPETLPSESKSGCQKEAA